MKTHRLMSLQRVLGFGLIICILMCNVGRLSAGQNVPLDEILLSISQKVKEAERLENEHPVKGANRRHVANQLLVTLVSGLDFYPSQAKVIIPMAMEAPISVQKRVVESIRRDFPGFIHLLKPIRGSIHTVRNKSLLSATNDGQNNVSLKSKTSGIGVNFSLTEIALGVSAHDVGAFGRNKESGGNFNLELRFTPFDWSVWRRIYNPQPHIGIHVNSDKNTNQIYAGAGWVFNLSPDVVVTGTLGLSLHDGKTSTTLLNRKELGSGLLFRESLEAGYKLTKHQKISIYLDHISNAGIAENNEGLDTFGLRFSHTL